MRFVLPVKEEAVGVPEVVPTPLALESVKFLVTYTVETLLGLDVLVVVVEERKTKKSYLGHVGPRILIIIYVIDILKIDDYCAAGVSPALAPVLPSGTVPSEVSARAVSPTVDGSV